MSNTHRGKTDAMQSAQAYRCAFEDKWFSIESDDDADDDVAATATDDSAAAKERTLNRRLHQAHMLRDIGALNFSQSVKRYIYIDMNMYHPRSIRFIAFDLANTHPPLPATSCSPTWHAMNGSPTTADGRTSTSTIV